MKLTDLHESRHSVNYLDGWYVVDKATDAVVAGPFESADEAQKKVMRPPMFANHHRYKIKAFGDALKEDLGKPVEVQIEKGLTREEAMKKAPYKKSYGDCRGFSYDKKTGIATWI